MGNKIFTSRTTHEHTVFQSTADKCYWLGKKIDFQWLDLSLRSIYLLVFSLLINCLSIIIILVKHRERERKDDFFCLSEGQLEIDKHLISFQLILMFFFQTSFFLCFVNDVIKRRRMTCTIMTIYSCLIGLTSVRSVFSYCLVTMSSKFFFLFIKWHIDR